MRIHLIGAGGAGMSAIGTVLCALGHAVSGSDLKDSPALKRLHAIGAATYVGHDGSHVAGVDLVAVSSAIREDNIEVVEARRQGIPVVSRATLLASVTASRATIAVAGTHGKTTTSSMLTLALIESGMDPSFIIGGELNEIGSGASLGKGEWMVVEADESDGTFLELDCRAAIVTNVEPDHIDHYRSFDRLVSAFGEFVDGVDGPVVICADDLQAAAIARATSARESSCAHRGPRVLTYGTGLDAAFRITDPVVDRTSVRFGLVGPGVVVDEVVVHVPGTHIARDAAAALVAAVAVGADVEAACRALNRFSGVARRFQVRGVRHGVTFIDDYAHLPGEIEATIDAARAGGWVRVVCVFQPHRYSRIGSLWQTYGSAFRRADEVVVTDIYAAGEAPVPGVSGELVVRSLHEAAPAVHAVYEPERSRLAECVRETLRPGDLCLVLSAGDLTGLEEDVYP